LDIGVELFTGGEENLPSGGQGTTFCSGFVYYTTAVTLLPAARKKD
jgi:hypothetical protein